MPYYIFHGKDEFSLAEEIAKLKSESGDPDLVDLNTTVLDGHQITLAELMHVCDAVPFLAERRLVIVKGLIERLSGTVKERGERASPLSPKDSALLKQLEEYLPRLPKTTDLIFVEDEKVKQNFLLYKQAVASKQDSVKEFDKLSGAQLRRWIAQRARDKGVQIDPQAILELTHYIGDDLRLLNTELEKLAVYVGKEGVIGREDVHRLVSYVREESIFALVDALGERKGQRAIRLLHQALEDEDEGGPLYLLSMIAWKLRLIIQAKELIEQRIPSDDIMRILGLRPFALERLSRQARGFTFERLKEIYAALQQIDVNIKTGRIEAGLALDLFIADVCRSDKAAKGAGASVGTGAS